MSEALIFASINSQYDNIHVHGITKKTTRTKHGQNMFYPCSSLVVFMVIPGKIFCHIVGSTDCGLVDARMSASEKDLLVQFIRILRVKGEQNQRSFSIPLFFRGCHSAGLSTVKKWRLLELGNLFSSSQDGG